MADIKADAPYIGEFGDYVRNSVSPSIGMAASQGWGYGCDKSGFTGLLYPLQGAMEVLARKGWEAGDLMQHKMQGTYRGLFATANSYAGMDNNNAKNLSNLTSSSTAGSGGTFSRYRTEGGGTFADAEQIHVKAPEVPKDNLSQEFEQFNQGMGKAKNSFGAADAINWFYENFISQDGRGLWDVLITPLTGDFNKIRANGAAWKQAGELFWSTSKNFSDNAKKLTESHWSEGKAAGAFNNHVDFVWTPVFLIARETCDWMQKGFEAIATASIRAAKLAVDLINNALNKLIEIALRNLNTVGFTANVLCKGVKWISQGFKLEGKDFPFWGEVIQVKTMIQNALKLYESINQVVEAAQAYYQGIQQIYKTAQQIPDVDSSHDVVDTVEGFGAGQQQMREAQQNFNEGRKAFQQALGGMQRATPR